MKRNGFNNRRPKKYRPTKSEQGLFTTRQVGQPPSMHPPTAKQIALQDLSAMKFGQSAHIPSHIFQEGVTGLVKRNLRRTDLKGGKFLVSAKP